MNNINNKFNKFNPMADIPLKKKIIKPRTVYIHQIINECQCKCKYSEMVLNRREYQRNYRRLHRAKHSEKIQCPCGGSYTKYNHYKHVKTKRHLKYYIK